MDPHQKILTVVVNCDLSGQYYMLHPTSKSACRHVPLSNKRASRQVADHYSRGPHVVKKKKKHIKKPKASTGARVGKEEDKGAETESGNREIKRRRKKRDPKQNDE
jgi:hypothetical protein